MRTLLLALISALLLASLSTFALPQTLSLECTVKVGMNTVKVNYTAPVSRMELTTSADGTQFGSSRGGRLVITLNGAKYLDAAADAAAEEYGVIIENGKLVYANLFIDDKYFMTFGKSFDDKTSWYITDATNKDIGGGSGTPDYYPANCN